VLDLEKLRAKFQAIEANLARLEQLKGYSREDFLADFRNVESAKRLFQVAIEAMIDAVTHVLARKRLPTPAGHAEAFTRLADAGLLPRDHIPTYLVMIKFRNRLVHAYGDVDDAEIYRILHSELGDFRTFLNDLASILALEPPAQCSQ
jgi:uncharacterized protein YutE (UPF0331/DUF86 family)